MSARATGAFQAVSFASLALALSATAAPLACTTEGRACYPGDYRACACGNGARGLFRCSPTGDAYGACDCSGIVPGTAPADAEVDAQADAISGEGGALLPFMAACASD